MFEPINMDYSKTILKKAEDHVWVPSPHGEVLRCQLEREYSEIGWATSLVRYPVGASFHEHGHPGGEQFLVLEGFFSDHRGDFGVDTYVQNPVGYKHSPYSKNGCLIFVRLGALSRNAPMMAEKSIFNSSCMTIKTDDIDFLEARTLQSGESITANAMEIFVVEGCLKHKENSYNKHSWMRVAAKDHLQLTATSSTKVVLRRLLR